MAFATASFVLLVLLSSFVIALSSMILAYVGGIAQKGSAEMKQYKVTLRKWLIGVSSILLILAAATFVTGFVQYFKPESPTSFEAQVARMA